jgi:thioredoxin 2
VRRFFTVSEIGLNASDIVMTCPECKAKNRVLPGRLAEGPTCGTCKAPLFDHAHPIELDDASFEAFVQGSPVPVLVDFWAAWCAPCRAFAPTLEQFAKAAGGRVLVAKVNVDDARRTAATHQVQAIPTLALFVGGREAARHVGPLSSTQLSAFVSAA